MACILSPDSQFAPMELWTIITIISAFLQNLRSALQKQLKASLSDTAATFVRFCFGLPFAILFLVLLNLGAGYPMPSANRSFLIWCAIAGLAQIAATFLLVSLFSYRNFVVGTAYSRTEPAQAAVFGLAFLGDRTGVGGLLAILITVAGVMLISIAHAPLRLTNLAGAIASRTALIGIASGTCFGLAAVGVRAASTALDGPGFLMQAAFTLAVTIVFQTVVMAGWFLIREPEQLRRIAIAWKPSLATGMVGATASLGWFAAMTLQQAAIVKAVAQIEIVFTIIASVFFFREQINRKEIAGTGMIVGGILLLLLL